MYYGSVAVDRLASEHLVDAAAAISKVWRQTENPLRQSMRDNSSEFQPNAAESDLKGKSKIFLKGGVM